MVTACLLASGRREAPELLVKPLAGVGPGLRGLEALELSNDARVLDGREERLGRGEEAELLGLEVLLHEIHEAERDLREAPARVLGRPDLGGRLRHLRADGMRLLVLLAESGEEARDVREPGGLERGEEDVLLL